jgi:hypothetical protein
MDRYEPYAPCPHCFESSGYAARIHPDSWSEPGWAEPDPCQPCPYCDATGMAPASEVGPDDERDEDWFDDGYLASLDQQAEAA